MKPESKLYTLLDIEGYVPDEDGLIQFLEDYAADSVVPGICMTAGCSYTAQMEPDQDRGWCQVCNEGTVKAGTVLAGLH